MVAFFKRDVRVKEIMNLDKDILLHKKNKKWKQDLLEENLLEN